MCSDWTIYGEILFHIIQNSIKFNKPKTDIEISLVYCQFGQKIQPLFRGLGTQSS